MAVTNGPEGRGGRLPEASAAPAAELRWRRVFPGEQRQLRELRQWLAGLLPGCAARDDVVTVAVELATNAVTFTASGQGGWFGVEITWHATAVRVAVDDGGAPAGPRLIEDPGGEHGRGLLMVGALSSRTGVCGGNRGRLVWAEIPWSGADATGPGPSDGDLAEVSQCRQAAPAPRPAAGKAAAASARHPRAHARRAVREAGMRP